MFPEQVTNENITLYSTLMVDFPTLRLNQSERSGKEFLWEPNMNYVCWPHQRKLQTNLQMC